MKKILIPAFFLLFPVMTVFSQSLLTVEDAVNTALKNNYDILVAHNDADIAKINNTLGNAGILPSVFATGTDNYSITNSHQELASGLIKESSSVPSNALNAALALNWTLFDGGKMFITKNKLNEIEKLGEIQFKDKVQQSVYDVIIAYYDVVNQKQQLLAIKEVISFNQERVKILQKSFDAGLSPKTDILQAKIDLNVNLEVEVNQEHNIITAKRTLNQLLSRDPDILFEVEDSIPFNYTPDRKDLLQKLSANNTSIQSYQKQLRIADLTVGENKSFYYPRLTFSGGYNFLLSNNSASTTVILSRGYGPLIGGVLSIPLYQSGNVRREVNTAKIQLQSAEYELENIKLIMGSQLMNALTDFENQQQMLKIEKDNLSLAKENLMISLERMRLGQTTSLEVHQAQESYAASLGRFNVFEYNLKAAETKLKQLIAAL